MRSIPALLQTHMNGEVTSVVECLTIERNDGIILRLTNHDKNITANGAVYETGATFNMSALRSSADLAVDNMQLDIGVDGTLIKKVDFDSDLYKRARFNVIAVNWQTPSDGVLSMARGWIGDITIRNTSHATLQLRGLTQALQRNFLSYYSPTCRASFGDSKCGVPTTPFTLHKRRHEYKVGDWALVPTITNNSPLTNGSFESNGVVANGTTGINDWSFGPGSYWRVSNTLPGFNGTYYLQGGNDAGAALPGTTFSLSRVVSTSSAGMTGPSIDTGQFIVSVSAFLMSPNSAKSDNARLVITLLDNQGNPLKVVSGEYNKPVYNTWSEIIVSTFVVPGTRSIKLALEGVKTTGALDIAFDDVTFHFWDATLTPYNSAAYKVVRIPGYTATDRRLPANYRFANDGSVSNGPTGITGWSYGVSSFWKVAENTAGLLGYDSIYFLEGGDNGTNNPSQEYSLISSNITITDLQATLLTAGSYIAEVRIAVAHATDTSGFYRAVLTYYNALNASVGTVDSGYQSAGVINVWNILKLTGTIPATATYAKVTLYARSGISNSKANLAFGSVQLFVLNTTLGNTGDATKGRSAAVRPTFYPSPGAFSYDGALIWEAVAPSFAFDTVVLSTDRRVFTGATVSGGEFAFHGARIIWLTGANAGFEGFVRTWTAGTKELRLYDRAPQTIAGGDKFMYSLGCGKSITDCSTRFKNAINFRGEPYLPGPQRIIEAFTPSITTR